MRKRSEGLGLEASPVALAKGVAEERAEAARLGVAAHKIAPFPILRWWTYPSLLINAPTLSLACQETQLLPDQSLAPVPSHCNAA